MIIPIHILPDLVYKTAHLHPLAKQLDHFGVYNYENLLFYQNDHFEKMFFTFINEHPYRKNNHWYYCLEDSVLKNWYWFTLNQLIICAD